MSRQERGERRAAAEQLAAERRADLSRVVSLEAQVAQARARTWGLI